MRKLFFILTLVLFHAYTGHAQDELLEKQLDYEGPVLQEWEVPAGVSFITITAGGAQGGNTKISNRTYYGGSGAQARGEFPVAPGSKLIILVGGTGSSNSTQAGGGGGTFVFLEDNSSPYILPDGRHVTPLIVAGGGGGAFSTTSDGPGNSGGSSDEAGKNTKAGSSTFYGGTGGNGGQGSNAGGGGGFLGDGSGTGNTGGNSILYSLGAGGTTTPTSLNGGFGGGGAGSTLGSGGGGGWSGGAGGQSGRGGGGGSYNASPIEETKSIVPNINAGAGRVLIHYSFDILPLKLTSFTAHQQQAGVTLRWNTAQERNTSHFEIQKSTDGRNFSTIGQVAAAGDSYASRAYSFTDSRPLSKVNQYRLKMVDNDGKVAHSKVAVIRTETAGIQLQVFPNPATSGIQLQTGIKGDLQIMIYDAKGSQVKRLFAKNEGMSTSFSIDVSYLHKGIYYVKVLGENELQTTSFIKK